MCLADYFVHKLLIYIGKKVIGDGLPGNVEYDANGKPYNTKSGVSFDIFVFADC
jgi:hypothetical protein